MKTTILTLLMLLNAQGAAASSLMGDDPANNSIDAFLSKYSEGYKPGVAQPAAVVVQPAEVKPAVVDPKPKGVVPVGTVDAAVVPTPKPNPCRDPKSTLLVCVMARKKAQEAADLKKAQDDAARKQSEAIKRRKAYPQCSKTPSMNPSTNDYTLMKSMADDLLGFDVTAHSLTQETSDKTAKKDRAQYWLQNSGGKAQLRLLSTFNGQTSAPTQVMVAAQGCQLSDSSVRLYGCGTVMIFTKCGYTVLTRIGVNRLRLTSPDDEKLNEVYDITSKSEISR